MGKFILYNGKRVPAIAHEKKGYWVLLNGEDVTGGYESRGWL